MTAFSPQKSILLTAVLARPKERGVIQASILDSTYVLHFLSETQTQEYAQGYPIGGEVAMSNLRTNYGRVLNSEWGVGAAHALYHKEGTWFNVLERFRRQFEKTPGANLDAVRGRPLERSAFFHCLDGTWEDREKLLELADLGVFLENKLCEKSYPAPCSAVEAFPFALAKASPIAFYCRLLLPPIVIDLVCRYSNMQPGSVASTNLK